MEQVFLSLSCFVGILQLSNVNSTLTIIVENERAYRAEHEEGGQEHKRREQSGAEKLKQET